MQMPYVLDLVLTNEDGMVYNLEYLPGLARSDHIVLRFDLVCYTDVSRHSHFTRTNYERLREILSSSTWEQMCHLDIEGAYDAFKSVIMKAVDDCSTIKGAHPKKNLYMDRTALQLRKRKKNIMEYILQNP